uniref:Uncharacterized protein n=1 Tax=Rhodosorus marinus TaxID=101924 RepID=A0A7S2ZW48_9RHOD|mmetsp:Transcript_33865/g.132996  ORF Transcript_33865/g.132996 Transcript_33865/m.132996 type:complete len:135 (+) Transcript_33865:626-1030(+)
MIAPAGQEGLRRGMVSVTERGTQTEERYEAGTIIDRKRRARKRKLFVDKIAEEMTDSTDYPQLDGIEFKRADRLSSPKRKRLLEEKIKPIEELTFDDIKKYNRNQLRAYCSVYGAQGFRSGCGRTPGLSWSLRT